MENEVRDIIVEDLHPVNSFAVDANTQAEEEVAEEVAKETSAPALGREEHQEDAPPPRLPSLLEAPDGEGLRFDGRDFYELLGVSADASVEDLRRAYKEQARAWHPDKAGPEFKDYFQILAQAHTILTDDHTRSVYDSLLQYFPAPRPTFAEVHGTCSLDVEPFRASTSNLIAVATFMHDGFQWIPRVLADVSWNRASHDKRRVRVAFTSSYALKNSADASFSPTFRSLVYDSVAVHLAHLLCLGGWRSIDESGCQPDAAEFDNCSHADESSPALHSAAPEVMLRHYVLGKLGEGEQTALGIRFAIEGIPAHLEVLFVAAHKTAHACGRQGSGVGCPLA